MAEIPTDTCGNCGHDHYGRDCTEWLCGCTARTFYPPSRSGRPAGTPSAETPDEAWFGCLTGDCPHDTQAECDAAIRAELVEQFREIARLRTALAASREDREKDAETLKRAREREQEALRAHAASAGALCRIADLVGFSDLDDYGAVVDAVADALTLPRPQDTPQ